VSNDTYCLSEGYLRTAGGEEGLKHSQSPGRIPLTALAILSLCIVGENILPSLILHRVTTIPSPPYPGLLSSSATTRSYSDYIKGKGESISYMMGNG